MAREKTMQEEKRIGDLLRSHGLRRTPIRMEMLALFMEHEAALSASDIMDKITADHDRVTIYRALSSFEEHGILHRASVDEHGIKYALCGRQCPDEPHAEQHAHFVCDACMKTFCLEEVEVPEVPVSKDYVVSRVSLSLRGLCKTCQD